MGLAMSSVPKAAPPMMSNSAGCSRTAMWPFSMRKPPITAPNTTRISIIANKSNLSRSAGRALRPHLTPLSAQRGRELDTRGKFRGRGRRGTIVHNERQADEEIRALRAGGKADFAAELLDDDFSGEIEAQAGSLSYRLGGEEGLKDFSGDFVGDAAAVI